MSRYLQSVIAAKTRSARAATGDVEQTLIAPRSRPPSSTTSSEAELDITLTESQGQAHLGGIPSSPARSDSGDPYRSRVGAGDIPVRVPAYLKSVKRLKGVLFLSMLALLIVQSLGFREDIRLARVKNDRELYGWGDIAAWAAVRAVFVTSTLVYLLISMRSKWMAAPDFTSSAHVNLVSWTFLFATLNLFTIPGSRMIYIWIHERSPPSAPPLVPHDVSSRVMLQLLDLALSAVAFGAAVSTRRGPKLYYPMPDVQTGFGINVKVTKDGSLADMLAQQRGRKKTSTDDSDNTDLKMWVERRAGVIDEPDPNVMDYFGSSLASFFALGYIYHVGKRAQKVDQLQQEDIPVLPQMYRTENFTVPGMPRFVRQEEEAPTECFGLYDPQQVYTVNSLFQTVWAGLWGTYAGTLMWEAIRTMLTLSGSFFMYRIISSFQVEDRSDRSYAYMMCFLLLCFRSLECFVSIYVWLRENFTCHVPVRSRTVALVLSKLLHARNSSAGESNNSDQENEAASSAQSKSMLLTMLGVDNKAIGSVLHYLGLALDSILAVVVGSIFLYGLLGNAVLVGMILIPVTLPISVFISKLIYRADKGVRRARDRRLNAVREFLTSIKLIKLNAYEEPLSERVGKLRDIEVALHRTRLRLGIVFTLLADQIPLASVAIALLLYSRFEGKPLEPARAFIAADVLFRVRTAAGWLPPLYQIYLQTYISANRVVAFLNSPDMSPNYPSEDGSIRIHDATVTWPSDHNSSSDRVFSLRNINLAIPRGLTVVTGKSGSGKTLLLEAILGEAEITTGEILAPRSHPAAMPIPEEAMDAQDFEKNRWLLPTVAYCSQRAVISHGTIRSNVLYAQTFVAERYWDVLHACNLLPDLDLFKNGEMQEIGERGVTLSGGQQARVALARAAYSRASTLLLDDVLAAVDVTCARHIIKHCFGGKIMEGRTVVLVSHSVHMLLPSAALLVTLDPEGRSVTARQPTELADEEFALQTPMSPNAEVSRPVAAPILPEAVLERSHDSVTTDDAQATEQLMTEEERSTGGVSSSHYWWLLRSAGPAPYLLLVLGLHILDRLVSLWESKILEEWTSHADSSPARVTRMYALANGVRVIVNLSMWLTIYGKGTQVGFARVGRVIHAALFDRMKRAPLVFFDTIPVGRIVNRFSADIWIADSQFSDGLSRTLMAFVEFVLACAVVVQRKPILAVYMAIFSLPYFAVASYFNKLRGDTARLRAVSESPQVSVYVALLDDISTVRAYGAQRWYSLVAARFVDLECRASVCNTLCMNWYRIWTFFLSSLLVMTISIGIVHSSLPASQAAFILTWSARISASLFSFLDAKQELDLNFVAAERLHEFSTLPPVEEEEGEVVGEVGKGEERQVGEEWLKEGVIEFDSVWGRYSPGGPAILRNVSFRTLPGERIAIVGPTGGGKSSLALAVFRSLSVFRGRILIDGTDVRGVPLHALRQGLALIPQEPVLTSGTLREALDLGGVKEDREVYEVLRRVGLLPEVGSEGGIGVEREAEGEEGWRRFRDLETFVAIGGSNLSVGQRQMLCLARALLKNSKILIMDEATSSIDGATDTIMQSTLSRLRGVTILTIAHRLGTIMDYDRVMVIDKGEVVECGTPGELLSVVGGRLSSLAEESGERETLERMAGL